MIQDPGNIPDHCKIDLLINPNATDLLESPETGAVGLLTSVKKMHLMNIDFSSISCEKLGELISIVNDLIVPTTSLVICRCTQLRS